MVVNALSAGEFADKLLEHIIDPIIAALAFIALLLFIVTAVKIVYNSDAAGDRAALFRTLWWNVFGIFVIFSVWTIITFVEQLAESDVGNREQTLEFAEYTHL